jgi:hypothetical protein
MSFDIEEYRVVIKSYIHLRRHPRRDLKQHEANVIRRLTICGRLTEMETTRGKKTATADETSQEIHKVTVRLPPFWPDSLREWFALAEAQFFLAGITDERAKFNLVLSQMDQKCAREVSDIITSPPQHEPYSRLKTELMNRLSPSGELRARQLLASAEIGDRKPSQFLRHLRNLAPDIPDHYQRSIWLGRPLTPSQSRAYTSRLTP